MPERGGGLEWFGSVLEADGLPVVGDSWLLHQGRKKKKKRQEKKGCLRELVWLLNRRDC